MIIVKQLDPPDLSYEDPFVLLSDGVIEIWVYADEFHHKVGDEYEQILLPLSGDDAYTKNDNTYAAKRLENDDYAYDLAGEITPEWNLKVGEFVIDSPNDTFEGFEIGDFVHVQFDRLDIWDCEQVLQKRTN
ncbi:hypothetical protein [Lactiplantibacillus herbarum]|uniref:hypothetical protein n=1 Tax=Lactiplantibacillus herbarum TaxID=1670446 RepID=UPI00064EAA7F|nr:hypothetical protein [Lactiplantibacillus herbarum]